MSELVEYGADDDNPEFGGLFGSVGSFLSNAAKTAGKEMGKAANTVQKAGGSIGKAIGKIPVVGAPVHSILGAAYHSVSMPIHLTVDIAIKGKRIDKAVMGQIKTAVKDVKDVGPYAQMVCSMVPGVGTGVSAAIGAGTALAQGQPIDKILVSAALGAVPGGPIAKAAAGAAAAGLDAAIHGKKLDIAAVSTGLMKGLPIPDAAKNALASGIHMTSELAKGKKIDVALADTLIKTGLANLPPDARKAFTTGLAIQTGAVLQNIKAAHLPAIGNKLAESGLQLAKAVPAVAEARKLAGKGTKGFDLGQGLVSQKSKLFDIVHVRNKLKDQDKKGFDMALATRIGMVTHKPNPKLTPAAVAGKAITQGMQGMTSKANKQEIMAAIVKSPSAQVGAKVAMNQIAVQREAWPKRVVRAIKLVFSPAPARA